MTVTIYNLTGTKAVRRSKNLAGIIRHAAEHGVNVVRMRPETSMRGTYGVTFYFHGGDSALTEWADWRVLLEWLPKRKNACPDRLTLPEAIYAEARAAGLLDAIHARGTVVTYA